MKKLVGLLAFAAALVGAILLTQYYTKRYAPPPPPPPPSPASAPAPPAATGAGVTTERQSAATYTDARARPPVTFSVKLATLDLAAEKGRLTLALERNPARAGGAGVWVWAYFFSPDAPGRYCAGEPVEVGQSLASGRAEVKVEMAVKGCPAPKSPSSTYYARVNVSTESAFAARLTEQRISYDVSQASPVVVEGKK